LQATETERQDEAGAREGVRSSLGRPVHRAAPVRRSSRALGIGLIALAGATAALAWSQWRQQPVRQATPPPPADRRTPGQGEAVAALGRLQPFGDIRSLAAPITGVGGSPRIIQLLVIEGEKVRRGQLLARFDNGPAQEAEAALLRTRITSLSRRLEIAGRDLSRYRQLAAAGAFSAASLDQREQAYLELGGALEEARAQLVRVGTDLVNTELVAPIDGTVLRIHARVGERPGEKGILELGDSDRMEALLEIYESDVERVRIGQMARITSENGGFSGSLSGRVSRIIPQVRQREVLSTDPTSDADARIVEVRVRLDPDDARRVRSLTGLKVIARLDAQP
jgi:HlyD family secretion protein